MRPAVVTAVLLLVAQTLVLGSTDSSPEEMCRTQYPATPCARTVSTEEGEEWFQMGDGRCVKAFFYTQHLTFDEAEKACVTYGGHLVSIHNLSELNQLVCTMYRTTPWRPPYWIGLKLSAHYEDYLVYDWTDGTDYDFYRFAYMQPNFYQESQECVEINYNFWGQWNDVNCNFFRGFVCAVNI